MQRQQELAESEALALPAEGTVPPALAPSLPAPAPADALLDPPSAAAPPVPATAAAPKLGKKKAIKAARAAKTAAAAVKKLRLPVASAVGRYRAPVPYQPEPIDPTTPPSQLPNAQRVGLPGYTSTGAAAPVMPGSAVALDGPPGLTWAAPAATMPAPAATFEQLFRSSDLPGPTSNLQQLLRAGPLVAEAAIANYAHIAVDIGGRLYRVPLQQCLVEVADPVSLPTTAPSAALARQPHVPAPATPSTTHPTPPPSPPTTQATPDLPPAPQLPAGDIAAGSVITAMAAATAAMEALPSPTKTTASKAAYRKARRDRAKARRQAQGHSLATTADPVRNTPPTPVTSPAPAAATAPTAWTRGQPPGLDYEDEDLLADGPSHHAPIESERYSTCTTLACPLASTPSGVAFAGTRPVNEPPAWSPATAMAAAAGCPCVTPILFIPRLPSGQYLHIEEYGTGLPGNDWDVTVFDSGADVVLCSKRYARRAGYKWGGHCITINTANGAKSQTLGELDRPLVFWLSKDDPTRRSFAVAAVQVMDGADHLYDLIISTQLMLQWGSFVDPHDNTMYFRPSCWSRPNAEMVRSNIPWCDEGRLPTIPMLIRDREPMEQQPS